LAPASNTRERTPLRFAVLLEGVRFNQWQSECVSRLVTSGSAKLELIIKTTRRNERPLQRAAAWLRHALWRAHLRGLGRKILAGRSDPRLFHDVEVFVCEACDRDGALELSGPDIQRIRGRAFDFVLYFGESTPADSLTTVAAQGVWSLRYGDLLDLTSPPLAAFRAAFLCRSNLVRVGLVGSRAQDGRVLREGNFAVPDYSFKKTLAGLLSGSIDFPVLACRDLLAGREFGKTLAYSESAHHAALMPGNTVMLKFFMHMCARRPLSLFHIVLMREQWNTGFLDSAQIDPFGTGTARDVRWLPTNGAKDFAADPFFLRRDDKGSLLVEEIDPTNNRGRIVAYQFNGNETVPLGTVIEEPVHLSYPCLARSRGQIYCVPEQAEAKSIILYRAIDFPLRWERLGPLLPGIEAIDSTLFEHGGYWWLAYTDASIDRNGRLMLWYAGELTGPWQPHALNPVKIDPRCSRGAGPPFFYRGALIRPSQDCSVTYGAKIVFNRIATLTPDQFREEMIGELRPDPAGPYSRALHTISYDGSIAIVDGRRSLFDLGALPTKMRSRLRRNHLQHNGNSRPITNSPRVEPPVGR